MKQTIDTECSSCAGSGVYRGMAEGPGKAVVCVNCAGTGCRKMEYTPFTGRKIRDGIKMVYRTAGTFVFGPMGPTGGGVTYQEFLNGKMPS